MIVKVLKKDKEYICDLSQGTDLSIGISNDSPQCFYAEKPEINPFQMGDFIGSTKTGSPVNYYTVKFNPHGNGTHTECVGHINKGFQKINEQNFASHFTTQVITVEPQKKGEDRVISKQILAESLSGEVEVEALIIRTLPNGEAKKMNVYTGQNPPYFEEEAMQWLVDLGVNHLLVDLPSVDKELDGGALVSHNTFWNTKGNIRLNATITELIYVPNEIKDGRYLLNLQRANFDMDCAPSRPIIYPFVEKSTKAFG